jgi:hypothetical protein
MHVDKRTTFTRMEMSAKCLLYYEYLLNDAIRVDHLKYHKQEHVTEVTL